MASAKKTIINAGAKLTLDGAREFKQSLGEINRKLKASQAELSKVTAAYGKNEQNVETLTARKEHLTNAMEHNRKEQLLLNEQLELLKQNATENAREIEVFENKLANAEAKGIGLERQLREVSAALAEQERALRGLPWKEFGEKIQAAGKKMQAVGNKMQAVGKSLSVKVTAPILAIGTAALAIGADFENTMSSIQASTGMASDAVDELSKEFRAMALSGEYGNFSAREIANAFNGVAVTGMDVAESVDLMRYSMVLATARNVDLGKAAYFLGEYLRKVGKDSVYGERYVNLFAQASANANIGLDSLQNYMFRMTPAFQQFGASSETNVGILTRMYQAGIRGANLYSGMGTIMMDLATRGDATNDMLERFNVSVLDSSGNVRDNKDILFDLAKTMAAYEDQTAMASFVTETLNQTQQQAWFEFMNLSEEIRNEVIPSLYDATAAIDGTGTAFKMAAVNQEGLIGTGQRVRATMEEIKLQISDHLMPRALELAEGFSKLIERFASLDEGTQRAIIKFAGAAAAMGPVLKVGGKLVSTAGKITEGFGKMAVVIGKAGGAKAALAKKDTPLLIKGLAKLSLANTALKTKWGLNEAAMKAYTLKMQMTAGKMGLLTKGVTAAKLAFAKLKVVMIANPILAVAAAATALVGVLVYAIAKGNQTKEAYRELSEESKRLTERQAELAEGAARAAGQFQEQISGLQNQAKHYRDLADSIVYLSSKQNLSAGEMALLDHQIAELNRSVPGLSLAFDGQTGALNMTTAALDKYLAAAAKHDALTAKMKENSRLRQEATIIEQEYQAVLAQRTKIEEKLSDGTRRHVNEQRYWERQIRELIAAEEGHQAALRANAELQEAVTQGIEIYSQALDEMYRQQQEATKVINETSAAMDTASDAADGAAGAMQRHNITAKEWQQAQEAAVEKIKRTYESFKANATNAFSAVSQAAVVSTDEMLANLSKNQDGLRRWSEAVAILMANDVPPALIQPIIDGGKGMADQAEYMVENLDYILSELAPLLEKSTELAMEASVNVLAGGEVPQAFCDLIDKVAETILQNQGMEDALFAQINTAFDTMSDTISSIGFDGLGENTVEGYVQGIGSRMSDVKAAGQETGQTYSNALKHSLEQNSPSRVTYRIGIGAVEGLINGTVGKQHVAEQTAKTLAESFVKNIADTINHNQAIDEATRQQIDSMRQTADMAVMNAHFESVGVEATNGVAIGIQNGGGIVSNAAKNMINNALAAMRAAADSRSPSRKAMKIAEEIGDGLIIGMRAKGEELAEVCKGITGKVMDTLKFDPSELMEDSKRVLQSMQTALPTLESNMAKGSRFNDFGTLNIPITINNPVVREESDIVKIAKTVKKEILTELGYANRREGPIFHS